MTALQWIVKEAKAIKKAYPKRFAKWTDYVAQASAIYAKKHKGKSPVGKKHAKKVVRKKAAKKKVSGVKDSDAIKRELAKKGLKMPHGYSTLKRKRKVGAVKKSATTMHKDTKSHNVNIRVMSGIVKPKPSIVLLSKKIARLTDINDHNKALLALAKFLKEGKAVKAINHMIKMHEHFGHMPQELISLRSRLTDLLLHKLKLTYGDVDYKLVSNSF